MRIVSWLELVEGRALATDAGRAARVTVGFFDGVHIGHRRLLADITAGAPGSVPVVVTFRQKRALAAEGAGLILTLPQRLRRLEALGVGAVVLIDFSDDFSTLSGRAFIDSLRGHLAIEKITVGPNFRFGRNRDADVSALGTMLAGSGTSLEVVDPVLHAGRIVSSSRVRTAIRSGAMDEARGMLGADHEIDLDGLPVEGTRPGVLRVPRLAVPQVLPLAGRYRALGCWSGGQVPGELSVAAEIVTLELAREVPVRSVVVADRL
jgi:riboflavin kinase/FMN adenylyltransferase